MTCKAELEGTKMTCKLCLKSWEIDDPKAPRCSEFITIIGSGHERKVKREGETK